MITTWRRQCSHIALLAVFVLIGWTMVPTGAQAQSCGGPNCLTAQVPSPEEPVTADGAAAQAESMDATALHAAERRRLKRQAEIHAVGRDLR